MKKLAIIISVIALSTSCEKLDLHLRKEKKDQPCAVVSSEVLPQAVRDAFAAKYPGATVATWFNKDNVGYAASFTQNGNKALAQFDNSGTFVKEDTDAHGEGYHDKKDHHDKKDDTGCSCELNSGD